MPAAAWLWGRRMLKEIFFIRRPKRPAILSELVDVLAKTAAKVGSLVL